MIEIIAVHVGGALPTVLEFNSSNLNFVQKQALQHLPRSPAGVPELRSLTKTDGHLPFKFKVAPELLSADGLPTLLTQWNEKYTHAVLTAMAKKTKTERDAAKAAGLWKPGVEKGDLNAMHQECTPAEATVFNQALADAQQKMGISKKAAKGSARLKPKPKLLDAVVDATTTLNVLTGEREQKQGAAESAVTTMRARQVIADVQAQVGGATADSHEKQTLSDPLEDARLLSPSQAIAPSLPAQPANPVVHDAAPDAEQMTKVVQAHREGRIKGPRLVEMSVADLFRHMDQAKPGVFEKEQNVDAEPAHAATNRGAQNLDTQPGNGLDQDPGSLDGVNSLPVGLDDIDPFEGYGDHTIALPSHAATNTNALDNSSQTVEEGGINDGGHRLNVAETNVAQSGGDAQYWADQDYFSAPELHHNDGLDQAQQVLKCTGQADNITSQAKAPLADWSALVSFRLDNLRSDAHALVLDTGEMFEALAYLQVTEPLAVEVQWLQDAFKQSDSAPEDPQALSAATDWLRAELDWRSKELMRWLGAADLVTPPATAEGGDAGIEKIRVRQAKKRPPGWVAKGCELALLAQSISLDIAMLEMTERDVERALAGMPEWAINAMQLMREFCAEEAKLLPTVGRSKPGAVFRDVWREELQRINRWCDNFSRIKIARQIGLFGSSADQKLLIRLEELIQRTRQWRNAPAPASQVLAVWLAFVLSLDHATRSDTAPTDLKSVGASAEESAQPAKPGSVKKLPSAHRVDKRPRKHTARGSNLDAQEEGQTCHA
jgi:hypothetical protein